MTNNRIASEIYFVENFKQNIALIDEIFDITASSYLTTTDLLGREIQHNKDIYLVRNDVGQLLSYFMVNFETTAGRDACYLGLSACRQSHKGHGLVKSLYQKLVDDCKQKEAVSGSKILLWWTTATPVVYYWFNKHISGVQPDMDGSYSADGAALIKRIINEKYPGTATDANHPFILRGAAVNTHYTPDEVARLKEIAQSLEFDVFEKFNVVESAGDRFLMFGYTPD